ncbi:CPBP family intramembrane glutamic endopeptidase [Bradyrhizobium sp. URHD0069]|uniref:CPBP family intramembrane glutamic endopeptidase n=1 Tax=Bradyrhizobium sp. URHD0069 TaxID=1380355 RepID=UPI0004974A3B|nr:type II CAAX endopeptidase family protein [Bradyrhizobium sp. URHD0069]
MVDAASAPLARTWGAIPAILATLAILVAGFGVFPFVLYGFAPGLGGQWNPRTHYGVLLASHALMVALVLLASGGTSKLALTRGRGFADIFVVTGITIGAIILVVFAAFALVVWSGVSLTVPQITTHGGFWLTLAAIVVGAPLSEELLFRGFLFPALARSLGAICAAIISSALWTSIHSTLVGHTPLPWHMLVIFFLMGLVLAWARARSGSVWPCILAHAMFNTMPALRIAYG